MKVLIALIAIKAVAIAAPAAAPETLYASGQAAYERADYATAIAHWQKAYRLSDANPLLFNIAQALRLSGDCAEAVATYKRFLANDVDPTSEQHKLAEDFARETCVELPPPPPVEPTLTPKPRILRHDSLRIAGLVTAGVGGASLTIGLVLGHHARTLAGDVTQACAVSCDWSVQKGTDAAGRRDAVIGYVLDATGAAAIVGGAVMYYFGVRTPITIERSNDSMAVAWRGSW